MRLNTILLLALTLSLACGALTPQAVLAQFAAPQDFSDDLGSIFSPAPRELRQRVKYAKEALEQGRFTEASAMLGNLVAGRLEESDNQDYFMPVDDDPQRMVSIKAEAQGMIGNMPPGGREVYELQFGAEARQMLQQALAQGDASQLAEVTRMFFHTKAGYEASLLLGRYYLDRGKPLAAALTLQNLVEYPSALAEHDPGLSLLLATCWTLADMPARARETLEQLQRRNPQAELQLNGSPVRLPPADADLLAWLETQLGGLPQFSRGTIRQWAMHRGEPARNAESEGGAPIYHPRWIATLNTAADEEELITKIQEEEFVAAQQAPLPAIHPLAVGDTVMVRTPSYLMGINFRTGKRVWTFPWDEASDWEVAITPGNNAAGQGSEQRRMQLKQRLFYDSPYGQLASDGESVFLIDDLGFAAIGGRSHFVRRGGVLEQNPMWASQFNQLMALDVAREGALRWTIGGQTGEDEPQLAGAFFLGPPLPLMGQLFVLAEINGEIRLVVIDAKTGRFEWSQQLAVVGQRTILTDQVRRLAGASPSFADGVLVCPTSAGAVVGVDVSTRTLLWGFTYPAGNTQIQNRFQIQQRSQESNEEFWADATVAIAGGKVILTPRESEQFFCLDLLTGKPLWAAKDREQLMYLACIHDSTAVFVGNNRVEAYNMHDGSAAWANPLQLASLPSGRGFYSGDHYYIPTTNSKLLKINLTTGEEVRSYETEHALGNLICFQNQVLSLTPQSLEVYYQAEPLRTLVEAQLKENPNNPTALAQHAELLLQDGHPQQALNELRRAWQLSPTDTRISRLLSKTMLTALHMDFPANRAVALELEPLLEGAEQQSEYLRLMASGFREMGESEKAFDAYMELATQLGDPATKTASTRAVEEVERFYSVRRDRWLQSQLMNLLRSSEENQRLAIEARITKRLEAAIATDTMASLRNANALFGFTPQAEPIRLRMAELLLEAGHRLEAEVMLTHLQQAQNREVAMQAATRLAQLLEASAKLTEALRQYRYIVQEFSEQPQVASDLLAAFHQRHAKVPLMGTAQNWPNGKTEATLENTRATSRPSYQRVFPISLHQQRGPVPVGMQVAFDQAHNDILITSGWGEELQRASLNRSDGRRFYLSNYNVTSYEALGHLVIASIGSEIVAIDTMAPLRTDESDTSTMLWRHDTYHSAENTIRLQSRGSGNPWGMMRYVGTDNNGRRVGVAGPITRRGVCVQRSVEVTCLDPLTGEAIWSRRDTEPGAELFGDEEYLFVASPEGPTRVFHMLDGSEVEKRDLPPEANRIVTLGRTVLCWKQNQTLERDDQLTMYLLDALTGETVWSRGFPQGTRATLVEHDELALVTPQGQLHVLRMSDGTSRASHQLELEGPLASLHVIRSSQEYLIAVGIPKQHADGNNTSIQPQPSGLYAPLLDGKLWCLERDSGAMRWQAPAVVDRYGLPLDQPAETPVLVLLRQINRVTRNGTRQTASSVLLIDKRDGRQLFADDDIGTQAYTYGLVGDPAQNRVTLELPGFEVRVQYTEDPRPPQPPAQGVMLSFMPNEEGLFGGPDPFRDENEAPQIQAEIMRDTKPDLVPHIELFIPDDLPLNPK